MQLVLSLFPGIGLLDRAFEEEGFCVVRGPDLLWGGDIKTFHPPAGKFTLQGLPADFLDGTPFTLEGKRIMVGNGVPLLMGRAVAKAVKRALGLQAEAA
jgi:site-specific DNA-cytosine methylase